MQKLVFALCATCFLSMSSPILAQNAQPAPAAAGQPAPKGKGEGKKGQRPYEKAGVTAAELEQLKTAQKAAKAERDAIKNDASLDDKARKAKLKTLHETQKTKVEGIIGKEKAEKLRAERKQRQQDKKGGAKKGNPKKDDDKRDDDKEDKKSKNE